MLSLNDEKFEIISVLWFENIMQGTFVQQFFWNDFLEQGQAFVNDSRTNGICNMISHQVRIFS